MARRVVVTGIGLVTPLAVGTEETWQALLAGKSGIGPITHFDHTDFATHFAGEVKGFDPTRWIDDARGQAARPLHPVRDRRRRDWRWRTRGSKIEGAVRRTGRLLRRRRPRRRRPRSRRTCTTLVEKGPRHGISPFFVPTIIVNLAPGQISIRHGAKGPNLSHVSACATGAHAIGEALRVIEHGDADAMICRRHRGDHHAARRRRLQRDARAVDAQRRAAAGVAARSTATATAS